MQNISLLEDWLRKNKEDTVGVKKMEEITEKIPFI